MKSSIVDKNTDFESAIKKEIKQLEPQMIINDISEKFKAAAKSKDTWEALTANIFKQG